MLASRCFDGFMQQAIQRRPRKYAGEFVEQVRREVHSGRLAPQVNHRDLYSVVPQLVADDLSCHGIANLLIRCQHSTRRATGCRAFEPCQVLESSLCVMVSQTVHAAEAGGLALSVVDLALLDVGPVRRNERSRTRELVRLVERLSLLSSNDGYRPFVASFRP
jgi:hypothetical protein